MAEKDSLPNGNLYQGQPIVGTDMDPSTPPECSNSTGGTDLDPSSPPAYEDIFGQSASAIKCCTHPCEPINMFCEDHLSLCCGVCVRDQKLHGILRKIDFVKHCQGLQYISDIVQGRSFNAQLEQATAEARRKQAEVEAARDRKLQSTYALDQAMTKVVSCMQVLQQKVAKKSGEMKSEILTEMTKCNTLVSNVANQMQQMSISTPTDQIGIFIEMQRANQRIRDADLLMRQLSQPKDYYTGFKVGLDEGVQQFMSSINEFENLVRVQTTPSVNGTNPVQAPPSTYGTSAPVQAPPSTYGSPAPVQSPPSTYVTSAPVSAPPSAYGTPTPFPAPPSTFDMPTVSGYKDEDDVYKVVSNNTHKIRIYDDDKRLEMKGCCPLPTGQLLIGDYKNHRIILVASSTYKVLSFCKLQKPPYSISTFGTSGAVISLGGSIAHNTIAFVEVHNNTIDVPRYVETDINNIRDVVPFHNELYVLTDIISVSDIHGKVQRKIKFKSESVLLFRMAISPDGSKMYLTGIFSAPDKSMVTINQNGEVLSVLQDSRIKLSYDVCVDKCGNVFVSGKESNTICQVSRTGRSVISVLATAADGMNLPKALCFDQNRSALLVAKSGKKGDGEFHILELK